MNEFEPMNENIEEEFDVENDPTLNAFIEHLSQLQKEYFSEPKVSVINAKRFKEFKYALLKITKIIKDTSPDAKIEYTLNDEFCIGHAIIEIETDILEVTNIKQFTESVRFATNFEVYPLENGNIKIGMVFHNMLNEIKPK